MVGQLHVHFLLNETEKEKVDISLTKQRPVLLQDSLDIFLFQKLFFFLSVYKFEQQGNLWRAPSAPILHPHPQTRYRTFRSSIGIITILIRIFIGFNNPLSTSIEIWKEKNTEKNIR